MPTPFLALNVFDGGSPQVKLFNGTQTSAQGVTFGALDTGASILVARYRVVQFGPTDTWYAVTGNQVYRTTNAGASWSSVLTLTSLVTNQSTKSGLHVCYLDGIPFLCLFWCTGAGFGSSGWTVARSSNGTSWSTISNTLSTFDGTNGMGSQYLWRNKIYALWTVAKSSGPEYVLIADPVSGVTNTVPVGFTNVGDASALAFCEFNGQLMAVYHTSGVIRLTRYSAGAFVTAVTLVASGAASPGQAASFGMLVDGDNLYCFVYNSTATGWQCYQVSSTFAATNISSTVIPTGMTGTTGGGNAPTGSRVLIMVDQEAAPGANPNKYVYFTRIASTAGTWTVFQWMGNLTAMQQIDSGGGTGTQALSAPQNPTGSYNWSSGERSVSLIDRSPLSGSLRLYFTLYSPSGSDVVDVNAYVGSINDEYPTTSATLADPSSGIMSGNTITGLIADNGATTYQVTWQSQMDGFLAGSPYSLILNVSS